ncbi:MAG: Sulfur carrier protein clustered with putative hydrolase SCO1113, partial [uncultured Frankineae bacterium]
DPRRAALPPARPRPRDRRGDRDRSDAARGRRRPGGALPGAARHDAGSGERPSTVVRALLRLPGGPLARVAGRPAARPGAAGGGAAARRGGDGRRL